MQWEDIVKIHCGNPLSVNPFCSQLDCIAVSDSLMEGLRILHAKFSKWTEMDAMVRVFLLIIEVVKKLDVSVSMQPTQVHHKGVTDVLPISKNELSLLFIEVKSFQVIPGRHTQGSI